MQKQTGFYETQLQKHVKSRLVKHLWLRLLCNSGNIVFGYEISRDFYAWALPLFALKTLFCWSRNYMLLLSRSYLSAASCAHHEQCSQLHYSGRTGSGPKLKIY